MFDSSGLSQVGGGAELAPVDRLEALFGELAQLCGQRNAIDGQIVDIVAEIERDELGGLTGARSMSALVAWKTGMTPGNAAAVTAVAHRAERFPQCTQGLREGRLSLDQVAVIADRAADGSDAHYAQLAAVSTVAQLRTATRLEPRPDPPVPAPRRSFVRDERPDRTIYKITLPPAEAATVDAAVQSHHDALISDYRADHPHTPDTDSPDTTDTDPAGAPASFPSTVDAFLSLITTGWDTEVARRPHGQHTQVVVHLDLNDRIAALHVGPLLSAADRQYLLCDATCEVWFEREGRPIGAGRATRTVNRRLRRALEHRDHTCVVPGCRSTRGLHAHHLVHWEDGGPTELSNLVLVCPYHHRAHHRGEITLTGPAEHLTVTDDRGNVLTNASLAHPPTRPPPGVVPCPGPTGEKAHWWWYQPFRPPPD